MTLPSILAALLAGFCCTVLHSLPLTGQRARRTSVACDRIGTATIEFGRTGGNIKPAATRLMPDGSVSQRANGGAWTPSAKTVPRDVVAGLARFAWTGGFTKLPTAPSRPTRNPDAARDFIELRSACEAKHVEYAGGEGAPVFREILALLQAVTR